MEKNLFLSDPLLSFCSGFNLRQPWGMNQLDFLPLTSLSTSRPALQLSHLAAYTLLLPCVSRVPPCCPHILLFKSVSPAASLLSPSPESHGRYGQRARWRRPCRGRHSSPPVNDTQEASRRFTSLWFAKRSGWAESAVGERESHSLAEVPLQGKE